MNSNTAYAEVKLTVSRKGTVSFGGREYSSTDFNRMIPGETVRVQCGATGLPEYAADATGCVICFLQLNDLKALAARYRNMPNGGAILCEAGGFIANGHELRAQFPDSKIAQRELRAAGFINIRENQWKLKGE